MEKKVKKMVQKVRERTVVKYLMCSLLTKNNFRLEFSFRLSSQRKTSITPQKKEDN